MLIIILNNTCVLRVPLAKERLSVLHPVLIFLILTAVLLVGKLDIVCDNLLGGARILFDALDSSTTFFDAGN